MDTLELVFTPTELTTSYIQSILFKYWKNIAINLFKWKGLETMNNNDNEDLDSITIEEMLFNYGRVIFFKDETLGYMALPALVEGGYNVYGKPIKYRVKNNNTGTIYNKVYKKDDCVVIKNNSLENPIITQLNFYCYKLAEIEMTKQLNLNAHKLPLVFETSEDTLLTAKNKLRKIINCEPVIFKNKLKGNVDGEDSVNAMDTKAQYIMDKLEDDYNCYVAKILTLIGLDNFVEDKMERVQSAEVQSNQEYIIASFKTMLDMRKIACDKINKKYGLNLSVEFVQGQQVNENRPEDQTDENVSRETMEVENE